MSHPPLEGRRLSDAESGRSATTRIVRVGLLSPIAELDPRTAVDNVSAQILGQIFEAPYTIMAGETRLTPLLFAENLRHDDGLTYSAPVRDGVVFSDGTPLTAEIAAASLSTARVLLNKARVEARGDRVYFTLLAPNPRFDLTLTQGNCAIVLERYGQLFGTGPFMFDQRPMLHVLQRAACVRLVRNPNYRHAVAIDEAQFTVCPVDESGRPQFLAEALRGDYVDLTTALTISDLAEHRLTMLHPTMQPGNSTGVLFFNIERLTSVRVRRGIAMCLNLQELAACSYDRNAAAFVATTLLPPMMRRLPTPPPVPDREGGMRLLEESGVKPERLSLLVPSSPRAYLPKPVAVAEAIQRQLHAAGIEIELLLPRSGEEYFGDLEAGNFDLALAGWIADTPDPADFFEALLWSKTVEGSIHSNHSKWKDERTDEALTAFRQQPSEENRKKLESIIRNEAPFIPLIYGQAVVIHSPRVRNVRCTATGVIALETVDVV